MLHSSVRKTLLGLAISATALLGAAGSAQAAVYKGAWDPQYGYSVQSAPACLQALGWSWNRYWSTSRTTASPHR